MRRAVCLLALAACAGCKTVPKVKLPPPAIAPIENAEVFGIEGGVNVHVTDIARNRRTTRAVAIFGIATNRSSKDLSTCLLKFQLLHNGAVTASAMASANGGLDIGQSWQFQAPISSPYGAVFDEVVVRPVIATPRR